MVNLVQDFACLNTCSYLPWFMVIHVYHIQVYSWCNFTFMNITGTRLE